MNEQPPESSDEVDESNNGQLVLRSEVRAVLSGFVSDNKLDQAAEKIVGVVVQKKLHVGPLPDPETLEGYGRVLSDAPERILKMAEKEQSHRHAWEKDALKLTSRSEYAGLFELLPGNRTVT